WTPLFADGSRLPHRRGPGKRCGRAPRRRRWEVPGRGRPRARHRWRGTRPDGCPCPDGADSRTSVRGGTWSRSPPTRRGRSAGPRRRKSPAAPAGPRPRSSWLDPDPGDGGSVRDDGGEQQAVVATTRLVRRDRQPPHDLDTSAGGDGVEFGRLRNQHLREDLVALRRHETSRPHRNRPRRGVSGIVDPQRRRHRLTRPDGRELDVALDWLRPVPREEGSQSGEQRLGIWDVSRSSQLSLDLGGMTGDDGSRADKAEQLHSGSQVATEVLGHRPADPARMCSAAITPERTAASIQPAASPVAVQSPAIARLSNPVAPGGIRYRPVPGSDWTYRSDGSRLARTYCASRRSGPVLCLSSHRSSQRKPSSPPVDGHRTRARRSRNSTSEFDTSDSPSTFRSAPQR